MEGVSLKRLLKDLMDLADQDP
uniref:Uncharacterized protein n=1 Tax=Moniliophthora roreri TaxID=221103 RepID=A0A0W0FM86_MONRR